MLRFVETFVPSTSIGGPKYPLLVAQSYGRKYLGVVWGAAGMQGITTSPNPANSSQGIQAINTGQLTEFWISRHGLMVCQAWYINTTTTHSFFTTFELIDDEDPYVVNPAAAPIPTDPTPGIVTQAMLNAPLATPARKLPLPLSRSLWRGYNQD